jgi:DNA-binding NarL/FixJ family response regulator
MPLPAARKDEPFPPGRTLVLAAEPTHREQLTAVVRGFGHDVIHDAPDFGSGETDGWAEIDAVLIIAEERDSHWTRRAQRIHNHSAAPPIVVLGAPSGPTWRGRALQAGAFVCVSREAPAEELQSIVSAAIRYRALVKDNTLLRVECERICMGLLQSYADVATNLKDTTEEVEALQRKLHEIRNRIIRAFV